MNAAPSPHPHLPMSEPLALPDLHPRLRDPAWVPRVGWMLLAALALWPLLVLCEFKPWVLLSQDIKLLRGVVNARHTLRFLLG